MKLQVYNFDSDNEYSYSELSNALNDMYVDSIKEFKKKILQKEMILKLEGGINHLNCALKSLKEVHTSLMDERCNALDTLVEVLILKLEIETLNVQLTHVTSLSCTCPSYSNERGKVFHEIPYVTKINRISISSKVICYYCGYKAHIRPFCRVRNV